RRVAASLGLGRPGFLRLSRAARPAPGAPVGAPVSGPASAPHGADGYRWVVLGAGTFAQATYGAVLAAANLGAIATLYPWGLLADRIGERAVLGGLCLSGACLAAAAFVSSFTALFALLF